MNRLFGMHSPLMQKLAQLPDLVLLNLLWLGCSLPIVTIGAATTALYAVAQSYAAETDCGVVKPFFRAFAGNFRQSTLLWLPLLLILSLLLVDYWFLSELAVGKQLLLWIPLLIIGSLISILLSHAFALMARYENDTKSMIRNSFLLFSLHPLPSLGVLALQLLPWGLLLFQPEIFLKTGLFWLLLGAALIACVASHIMLPIYRQHDTEK